MNFSYQITFHKSSHTKKWFQSPNGMPRINWSNGI